MRSIPANALTKLATTHGTEPIIVIQVEWRDALTSKFYADKTNANVKGKILSISGLDEVVQVSGGGQSQQVTIVLDDTDFEIKTIFDNNDVHKKSVRIFQWFQGLSFADKFLIFKGQINSPIEWDEGQRTFTFTVINRIEDVEVGFSAEEGQFVSLPEDLIGRPWPLVFGTVINVPALKAVPATSGVLGAGIGIKDFTLSKRLTFANAITCPQTPIGFKCAGFMPTVCVIAYEPDGSCIQAKCTEIERITRSLSEQKAYEYPSVTIFGGKRFQQGTTITLNINGGLFTGKFDGTAETPSDTFLVTSRFHPRNDGTGKVIQDPTEQEIATTCEGQLDPDNLPTDFTPSAFGDLYTGIATSKRSWDAYRAIEPAGFFWAGGGTTVTLNTNNEITYIANILPSTILRVAAWRTVNGNRYLLTVPDEFFEIRQTDYNGYDVMEIVFQRSLTLESKETGGGWEDEIYVTLTSSVGPNTVDIIRWFIETYTTYSIDEDSFDEVRELIDNYPMHFPLLQRKNLLTVLQELAKFARCAIWMKDDTFFIRYLSAEPETVDTITEDDVLKESLAIVLTPTEDVTTKYNAKWQSDYSLVTQNTLILRHNVIKYGTQEKTEQYYPYNILDLVRKSATFWLIRLANTWKRVKISTPLTKLNLEAFDAVTLDLPQVADVPITAIVEKAVYNSETKSIDFELWTPVKSGTMMPYDLAFPANIEENVLFPTIDERQAKFGGSGTEPNFSVIAPPNHPLVINIGPVITGFSLRCNGDTLTTADVNNPGECRQDHGDKKPSDENDEKPEPPTQADNTGDINVGSSPVTKDGTSTREVAFEANDKAKQANDNAVNAQKEAQRAVDASGADNTDGVKPKDLPDPSNDGEKTDDELQEECIFLCSYILIEVATVEANGVMFSSEGCGRVTGSITRGVHTTYFSSAQAAYDFGEAIKEEYNRVAGLESSCVGDTYRILNNRSVPPGPAHCQPEGEDDGAMVGYKPPSGGEPDDGL